MAYADQTVRDWKSFLHALETKRIGGPGADIPQGFHANA
jgi:hypothetical protein